MKLIAMPFFFCLFFCFVFLFVCLFFLRVCVCVCFVFFFAFGFGGWKEEREEQAECKVVSGSAPFALCDAFPFEPDFCRVQRKR